MPTLAARRLAKRYKNRYVVNDVSLTVQSGEIIGLLGPNGAGKTTSFYMIIGLVACDSGTVHLDMNDLTRDPIHVRARAGLGYLPQEPSIFRRLSVRENVMAILETRPGLTRDDRQRRVDALLDDFNISHLVPAARRHVCPGGERRRVEIARSLAAEPAVHAAGRTVRGRGSHLDPGYPADHQIPERPRDRHPDHRPQRARHPRNLRSGIHRQRGDHDRRRHPGGACSTDERVREVYLGQHFKL